jgi:hypothetical protein
MLTQKFISWIFLKLSVQKETWDKEEKPFLFYFFMACLKCSKYS